MDWVKVPLFVNSSTEKSYPYGWSSTLRFPSFTFKFWAWDLRNLSVELQSEHGTWWIWAWNFDNPCKYILNAVYYNIVRQLVCNFQCFVHLYCVLQLRNLDISFGCALSTFHVTENNDHRRWTWCDSRQKKQHISNRQLEYQGTTRPSF